MKFRVPPRCPLIYCHYHTIHRLRPYRPNLVRNFHITRASASASGGSRKGIIVFFLKGVKRTDFLNVPFFFIQRPPASLSDFTNFQTSWPALLIKYCFLANQQHCRLALFKLWLYNCLVCLLDHEWQQFSFKKILCRCFFSGAWRNCCYTIHACNASCPTPL